MKKRIRLLCFSILIVLLLSSCGKSEDVIAVEKMIDGIGEVSLANAENINQVIIAYSELSDEEKAKVSNYQVLYDDSVQLQKIVDEEQKRKALEEWEESYKQLYTETVHKMLDTLVIEEKLCNLIQSVWHNCIYKLNDETTDYYTKDSNGKFFEDFNDALQKLWDSDISSEYVTKINKNDSEIVEASKALNDPPEKYKGSMLDTFLDYYVEYKKFLALPYSQESLTSFKEKFDSVDNSSIEAYTRAQVFCAY